MRTQRAAFVYLNPLFLIIWFFIWGICPWDTSMPVLQAAQEPPVSHHRSGATDTHHASKGTEHSCSGSISYTQSDPGSDRLLNSAGPAIMTAMAADRPVRCNLPYFFEATSLPRLLTAYYQLYSVYRI